MDPEGQDFIVVQALRGSKGRLLLVSLCEGNLPVTLGDGPSRSINSSTLGMGSASHFEISFTFLKSLQNLSVPSGLGIRTMGLAQALWDSSMTPFPTSSSPLL